MKKVCVKCGTEFTAGKPYLDKILCDSCAAKSANRTVLRDRVCVDCGVHFIGFPRSMRCGPCNAEHKKELDRKHKREGSARKIGSVDICVACGKQYIVEGGMQRYCKECAPIETKKNERAKSREWARENIDYEKRQRDREASIVANTCVVCGKEFKPNGGKTCSKECSVKLSKMQNAAFEASHKEERNAYHKRIQNEKIKAMSPEELAAYRERVNAKARENYRKRKDKIKNEADNDGI